jgi:6-phosphofructokinase 2
VEVIVSALVVTVTFTPCLDISTAVDTIEPWHKLRCSGDRTDAGGGGINVARVVRELGGAAVAVAALGGHVGARVAAALERERVELRSVRARGETRENFSVTERSTGRQFRFVRAAPAMTAREWQRVLDALVDAAGDAACVVGSGSLPPGVPDDIYSRMTCRLAETGVPVILDASGPALRACRDASGVIVKPSERELASLVGRPMQTADDCVAAAGDVLATSQWKAIIVSRGADGALLVTRDGEPVQFLAPALRAVSTIGAGDSMVAGVALSLARGLDIAEAVRFGVAAGSAAVLNEGTALCAEADVIRLLHEVSTVVSPTSAASRR